MARTFTVTRKGSKCVDCSTEMAIGVKAVYLGRSRYAHFDPCTTEQVERHRQGDKGFWRSQQMPPSVESRLWTPSTR
jgi:hypothetical protein